jgi:hypothetical protein
VCVSACVYTCGHLASLVDKPCWSIYTPLPRVLDSVGSFISHCVYVSGSRFAPVDDGQTIQ